MSPEIHFLERKTPLTAAQQKLVEDVLPLVKRIAERRARRTRLATEDELYAAGYEGAVEAAQTYDSEIGNFEAYAWPRIDGAMKNFLYGIRKEMRFLVHGAFDGAQEFAEAHTDPGGAFSTKADREQHYDAGVDGYVAAMVAGYAADNFRLTGVAAMVARQENDRAMTALTAAKATLPERDRTILQQRYAGRVPLRIIGKMLGVSYASIRRYHNAALQRLAIRLKALDVDRAPVIDLSCAP